MTVQHMSPFAAFQGIDSDPAHSPMNTNPDGGEYGLPLEVSTHLPRDPDDDNGWWTAYPSVGVVPDPAIGGRPGDSNAFGWTTGLRPRNELRQPLNGATLVVPPGQAMNPNIGSVGRDKGRSGLGNRVAALSADYLPPLDQIAAAFTHPKGAALMQEIQSYGDM